MGATCKHGAMLTEGCDDCGPVPATNTQQGETLADSRDVDRWKTDLLEAGWIAKSAIKWQAPDGSLWRGPYGAWKELQRRATVQADLGLDTNFPLSETLRLLVEWAQHLHDSHECDCDGWEQRSFLIEAAQGYQREIMQSAATSSPTPAESRVADMAEPKSEAEPTCVHCGRELEYREYGPPINDTTWSHVHNGVVWCHWPTTPEKAREIYVAPAERTREEGEQEFGGSFIAAVNAIKAISEDRRATALAMLDNYFAAAPAGNDAESDEENLSRYPTTRDY